MRLTYSFAEIRNTAIEQVGGKNASLGELYSQLQPLGLRIPQGFALSAEAWRLFLRENQLEEPLRRLLQALDTEHLSNLPETAAACRDLVMKATLPAALREALERDYLAMHPDGQTSVAVRSSATAEDLPGASFAGQHDSFLHIEGVDALMQSVQRCYASLFNDRAIKYRIDNGFAHEKVALSVGVQRMVRSDLGSAGVAFTLDPESGAQQVIYLTGAWGLGENIVQGSVTPDEFYFFKPSLQEGRKGLIYRRIGAKETRMVYSAGPEAVQRVPTTAEEQRRACLSDADAETLGRWCLAIEQHYGMPMDIEWALDGEDHQLYILQARPETVHGSRKAPVLKEYTLHTTAKPLVKGMAVGRGVATGRVCLVDSLADAGKVQQGDIIVADTTNPDWNALLRKAVCIVTNRGGRTSHASIVARELGIHAVVGTGDATQRLQDGDMITVACTGGDEGQVYVGALTFAVEEIDVQGLQGTRTNPMLILADPGRALALSAYPARGVGLLRMEFIIARHIGIHPMAAARPDLLREEAVRQDLLQGSGGDVREYFIRGLSEGVALVAAAFHPFEVIVRMSDFKSNEYAHLPGGADFEPEEENPMIGFRGASRYDHPRYREGFGLECEAMRRVRDEMGLRNVKLMIPFCRTPDEGRRVLETMKGFGLERGLNGLEVYMMAEIPSNVLRAAEFANLFDGFSIGSNDLTQLTLGIDRDSELISDLFSERDPAVMELLRQMIGAAKKAGRRIGLCGQAPSDDPEFARFLVDLGIDSISFTPDALLRGIAQIQKAEQA